jgi:hypothetical protein
MKNLNDFLSEKVELKKIFGGDWISTSLPDSKDKEGCTVKTTDSVNDTNGNGKHDSGESASVCVSISC